MEFRDGKVVRERIYFGEPWEPPAWRAQWVEPMASLSSERTSDPRSVIWPGGGDVTPWACLLEAQVPPGTIIRGEILAIRRPAHDPRTQQGNTRASRLRLR